MNVFQVALVFIGFVAAKGSFPAVILKSQYFLAEPKILPFSDTEMEVGFDEANYGLYAACPIDHIQREENEISEILVEEKVQTKEKNIYLDELPKCELQPQVTFKPLFQEEEYTTYAIGYKQNNLSGCYAFRKVYKRRTEDDHDSSRLYSSQDEYNLNGVFALTFNTSTEQTISVKYDVSPSQFNSTASNKKLTFVYKKDKEFNLDNLYQNFIDQILPQMVQEKSANQLAHALGIQKVQLATPDDFPLDTWKMTTYWDINTVPLWRVLLLRWNAIEIYLRKLCKRNIFVRVKTGVSGMFELPEIYYDDNTVHKLHTPKYVWKVITETYPDNKAMLIVMHNDPFTENQEPLCVDICASNGWLISNNDYRTGLVYCCEMTENIRQMLKYFEYKRYDAIHSLTKYRNGAENLEKISRLLSDPQEKLYDW